MTKNKRKRQQKNTTIIIGVLAALLLISVGYIAYITLQPQGTPLSIGEIREADGETYFSPPFGFAEADVLRVVGLQTIIVGVGCNAIVADTSPERAAAIRDGLAERINGRPNAYDQWSDLLSTYGIVLEGVTIHDFVGNMYVSTGVFRQGDSVLEQDMRPSDAMALAVRTDTPIYINSVLLTTFGEDIC